MPRISLCIIHRNDEENLCKLLQNVKYIFDEFIIVDTSPVESVKLKKIMWDIFDSDGDGVSDDEFFFRHVNYVDYTTVHAPQLLDEHGNLRSFSEARNLSFARASGEWLMWLDTDDLLSGPENLRSIVDELSARRERDHVTVTGRLLYKYSWNEDRSHCEQAFYRERIVHRDDYVSWVRPVHEYFTVAGPGNRPQVSVEIDPDRCSVIHQSQGARGGEGDRNMRLLLKWWEEALVDKTLGDDPALDYYLGDEFMIREQWESALGHYIRAVDTALELPWSDKTVSVFAWRGALRAARVAAIILKRFEVAIQILDRVLEIYPDQTNLLLERASITVHLCKDRVQARELARSAMTRQYKLPPDPAEDCTDSLRHLASVVKF